MWKRSVPLLGFAALWLAGCSSSSHRSGGGTNTSPGDSDMSDVGAAPDLATSGGDDGGAPTGGGDPLQAVFDSVSQANLLARLQELTGAVPVTAGGSTFSVTERWSPTGKANFRAYWKQYMQALGASVNELPFPVQNLVGETTGHNLEAILPGASADTLIIITHYDTVGIKGQETKNPGADDDGSGLAMQMEAARIFASLAARQHTVRFVACDYEEISWTGGPDFPGPSAYLSYLQGLTQAQGFKVLMVSDNDQTGWSCWDESAGKSCYQPVGTPNGTFRMLISTPDATVYDRISSAFAAVATRYGSIKPEIVHDNASTPGDTQSTDQYPFGLAGLPAYVVEEYGDNPHYDDTGGDLLSTINLTYLLHIAQIQVTFQATILGL